MSPFLPWLSGPLGWLPVVVLAALLLNGLRLRGRLRVLALLGPGIGPVSVRHRFVTAEGVVLDQDTQKAASAFALKEGLKVVDLVPGDLSFGRATDLVRAVDTKTFRRARFAHTASAGHALLVDTDVIERAEVDKIEGLSTREIVELTVKLKRFACTAADFAVAPGLRGGPERPEQRAVMLETTESFGGRVPVVFTAISYVALAVGVVVYPLAGFAALLVFCLQPYLMFAGRSPVRPADLHRFALLRLGLDPSRWWQTYLGLRRSTEWMDKVERLRPSYTADLANGTERFFEPRRPNCPWCGSTKLSTRVRSGDMGMRKPGRFVLEQCRSCEHTFQNPRLSLDGLEFYYRDVYDGLGGAMVASAFDTESPSYRGRAEIVAPFTTPKTWLDVGAGHGHFCNFAREVWPDTVFDGLDMSESIDEAARRGWVGRGFRGMFPDLVGDLAGRYDVVSMHHYLEHTREPYDELDAASKVLSVGGFLLIELPDPECRFGRLLGGLWMPWLQPQHQHMIPLANLKQALADRGFTTVAQERGRAHQPCDLVGAAGFVVNRLAASPKWPWSTKKPTWWRSLRTTVVVTVGIPFVVLGYLGDRLLNPIIRRTQGGNSYRVLARLDS